ncbi:MAG: MarR family transcriptional regulator [Rhizobiaceae bacterium]|nr:MarR family transcriptional regulator [Rhizobiaceae bacterium]
MSRNKAAVDEGTAARSIVNDDGLRQFLGYHMKRAYSVLKSDLTKSLEPLGLRITTYSSLILIVDNPGIRQSELARNLDIERPNMVVILDELEQRGWVNRERVESDRRSYALFATLSGRQVCEKAITIDRAHEARLFQGLKDAQIKTLIAVLNNVERQVGE